MGNGDRVLVSDSRRAVLVTKGDSPEARVIRSLDHRSRRLVTVGDIVIYTRTIDALSYASAQIMVALGGDTLEPKWERDFGANVIGMWSVDGRLLVATSEVLHAIDAASGRLVWQQRLERLRGGATIEKDGNRLFVMCTVMLRDCRSPIFLYCLDERTGHVQWQYDLGYLPSENPLIVQNGKLYTHVHTSRLLEVFRVRAAGKACYRLGIENREWTTQAVKLLPDGFALKTQEEIELNLRAWHAFGDGSAIGLLRAAEEYLADGPLSGLPRKLIDTFPPFRRPFALIDFLEEQFENQPELRTEIGRIVDDFKPVPLWYKYETYVTYGLWLQPYLELTLLPEREALIEAWEALKLRTDAAPVTRFTREAVGDLMLNKRVAEFDAMLAAHEKLSDADERMMLRMAMYAQHPTAASDWALEHLELISTMEITQWVPRAPIEWLLDHEDLYLSWLLHDYPRVGSSAMIRISRMGDSSPALPICERFLESSILRQGDTRDWSEKAAINVIGQHGSRKHIPLLKRFIACKTMPNDADAEPQRAGRCARPHAVKVAAAEALAALGVHVTLPPPPAPTPRYTEEESERMALHARINQLENDLYRACQTERTTEAKAVAREIVALFDDETIDHYSRDRYLTDAYEVLEEWDKAIEHTHRQFGDYGSPSEWRLLELYEGGSRWNDIEALVDRTRNSETRINGAFALINGGRLEKAFNVLRRELREHPNSSAACCGLAMVHFKREEFSKADAMMERAIALRPHACDAPSFRYTIEYWLKREQPEKARAWVRTSIELDPESWRHSGLLEWTKQFPELAGEIQVLEEPSGWWSSDLLEWAREIPELAERIQAAEDAPAP
ncbi:MAG: PQQ-binding-like beta-propeller repeat protein [Planctomycetes bacterium]|nr:PQQ-binding-like beta-propeller repeat protein [Planctomycetota bacterium]